MNNYLNHICKNYLEIVKKAYNEKNVWIYVYLQSFVEKILKKYIVFKKAIFIIIHYFLQFQIIILIVF